MAGAEEAPILRIPRASLVFGRDIGRGCTGIVHEAQWNGRLVAVKVRTVWFPVGAIVADV